MPAFFFLVFWVILFFVVSAAAPFLVFWEAALISFVILVIGLFLINQM